MTDRPIIFSALAAFLALAAPASAQRPPAPTGADAGCLVSGGVVRCDTDSIARRFRELEALKEKLCVELPSSVTLWHYFKQFDCRRSVEAAWRECR